LIGSSRSIESFRSNGKENTHKNLCDFLVFLVPLWFNWVGGWIWRLASGIRHPAFAHSWHNLAVTYHDEIIELFEAAAADREHGALEIEETLIRGLLDLGAPLRLDSLHHGLKMVAEGQPAMANLRSMAAWMAAVESPASCRSRLARRAAALQELPDRLAAKAWPLVEKSAAVVTISRSSAVAAVVEGARRRGWGGSVVVLDGTASGRGADQAGRLSASGSAVSRPDSAASEALAEPSVVVMVGADAVGRQRFVNSAGTGALLEAARHAGVEAALVADSGKDVTEDDVDDIVRLSPLHRDEEGHEWPIFEAISLDLITARVTE
jgi:translation initiation factor 2B subunit (eIF-2B alpha/beta/delta family)